LGGASCKSCSFVNKRFLGFVGLTIRQLQRHKNFEETFRSTLLPYKGFFVNKTELIEHIAKHADISKAAATRSLESTIGAIKTTLKKGGSVSLVGFGTFAVGKRAARVGRNPRTGDAIKIKAAKVPKFRPGKALKDALN
jgi:DNA-binding protein HU-beta